MSITEYVTDPASAELGEHVEGEPAAEVEPLEVSGHWGASLLVALAGGMALVLAVLTPVAVVQIAGLVIVGVAALVVCRLLARGGEFR